MLVVLEFICGDLPEPPSRQPHPSVPLLSCTSESAIIDSVLVSISNVLLERNVSLVVRACAHEEERTGAPVLLLLHRFLIEERYFISGCIHLMEGRTAWHKRVWCVRVHNSGRESHWHRGI